MCDDYEIEKYVKREVDCAGKMSKKKFPTKVSLSFPIIPTHGDVGKDVSMVGCVKCN